MTSPIENGGHGRRRPGARDSAGGAEGSVVPTSGGGGADEAGRQSWRHLRTIIEAIPVPVVVSRLADGEILLANARVEMLFGLPAGGAIGRRTAEFYFEPDDRLTVLARVMESGRLQDCPVRVRKADGTARWVAVSLESTSIEGETVLLSNFVDITERQEAEEALRQSEQRFRTLCESAPTGIFLTDPIAHCTYVNNALQAISGLSFQEALGQGWMRLIHPEDRPGVEEAIAAAAQTGGEFAREFRIITPPGEVKQLAVRTTGFRAPDGAPVGRIGTVEDITARKRSEQALQASERLFRTLADTVPVGITIVQDGVLRYVNPTVTRLMGYSAEEMIGAPFWSFVHPDMQEEVRRRSSRRAEGLDEATRFEMRILTKGGAELWVDQSVAVVEYDGRFATMGAALDVTHRKRMETLLRESREMYQTLVENVDIGIALIDRDYHVLMANAAEGRLVGRTAAEILGKKCHWEFERREEVCPHCPGTVAMQTGRTAEAETEGVRADGTRFNARVRAFPLKGADGVIFGFIEVVENITERLRAERAISESEAKYRTLVEQLPAIIYITPPNAGPGTDYMSPYVEKVLGYSPAEYTHNPNMWRDHLHPDDRARVLAALERSFAEGEPYTSEYRMIASDGRIVWFRDEARLIRDENGTPLFLQGIMFDTTERMRAAEELEVGRHKLADIIEATHVGTWEWNLQTGATVFDDRWAEIAGYTAEELRPTTFQTWADLVHPDDLAESKAMLQRHFAGALDYYACEVRMKHKKGSWVWVSTRGRVVEWTADGKPLRMMGTHADVSARKRAEQAIIESEAKYRTLVERIPAIIYISPCQKPSATTYVNSCVERVLGYKPLEYEKEDLWLKRLHPDDRDRVLAELSKAVAEGCDFVSEYRMFARDGRIVWMHDEASIVRDAGGTPLFLQGVMLDISEQKQAHAELKKFKTMSEQTMLGNTIIDMEGRICYVNEAQARMHGYAPEELIGQHVSIFHPPSAMPEVNQRLEAIKREGRATGIEVLHQRRDGTVFPTLTDSTVISGEKGEPQFLAGIAADISELKRAETELRKFKTIADETSHAQSIISLDGKILYLNNAFARMHGYAPEELLGKDMSAYHTPEQMVEVTSLLDLLKREGRFANEEVWHVKRDGTVFPTIMDAVVVSDDKGMPLFLSGMAVDITERKHVEAALRRQALVFNNINDGVIITDAQGRITDWNPGAERIFDYFRDEVIGRHPEMLNKPADAKAVTRSIQEGLARDGYWSGEIEFVRKDGTEGVCEVFVVPLYDENHSLIGRIAVNRDITARKQMEEESARLEVQLHQAQKMEAVGTLADGVAHDFNNLLTAIFGYTDLAKSTLPGEHAAVRALEMVEQAGRQARGVINSLLAFSRKSSPEKVPVDLVVSLADTIRLLRRLLPASIELEEDLPHEQAIWVNADATQLQQVWMNLAVNARDAMPRGGRLRVALRVATLPAKPEGGRRTAAGRPHAVVLVEDTGTGMSEETRARVFEPFFTTKPRGQGTGLGLSVTHAIVTNHDGQIEIGSQDGRGTRVTITLPCCEPPPEGSVKAAAVRAPAGRGQLILVIEEDEQIRSILVSSLRGQGYQVIPASDSVEAEALVQKHHQRLDLVLLDMDLPRTRGKTLLNKIRLTLPDTPILAVTGGPKGRIKEDASRNQFLLRKPLQVSELDEVVARLLGRRLRDGGPQS